MFGVLAFGVLAAGYPNGDYPDTSFMGQFVGAIKGIGEAVAALGMPIVSGNVSLYNETDGVSVFPTPSIATVGVNEDQQKVTQQRQAFEKVTKDTFNENFEGFDFNLGDKNFRIF